MKICHIGKMGHIRKEGMITQDIYDYCNGKHIYYSVYKKKIPAADIYVLHCFRNDYDKFVNWKSPRTTSRVISLIHSYEPCMPCKESDIVVTISKTWQKHLRKKYNIDSEMIYPGIDLKPYEKAKINYKSQVFGKISRAERDKYHEEWNYIILDILKCYYKAKYRLISNKYYRLPIVKHRRAKYIEGVKINQTKKKIKELCKLGIYADAHGDFNETFCMSLLEAMACGLPCIIYGDKAMIEVLGYGGLERRNIKDFKDGIIYYLNSNITLKKCYGESAKKRAEFFSLDKMINSWNKLFKGIV